VPDASGEPAERAAEPMEIERKYLLDGCPDLPPGAEAVRIEQGYLPDPAPDDAGPAGAAPGEGRLRRTTAGDGTVVLTHTIKRGDGLCRTEIERTISAAEFERAWPGTAGRRLAKTRFRVPGSPVVWEIDVFDDFDLVLAEAELPSPGFSVTVPNWLAPHVVREVTDDPRYRNFALATGRHI
jgi:CYTH domain-containing protein